MFVFLLKLRFTGVLVAQSVVSLNWLFFYLWTPAAQHSTGLLNIKVVFLLKLLFTGVLVLPTVGPLTGDIGC